MGRPSSPPDPAKVLDAALDVFVYAPIGLLFDAREVVPKLAERGKNQVALARLFGRYAISRGQAEADRLIRANKPAPAPAPKSEAPPATTATMTATEEEGSAATQPPPAKKAPANKTTANKTTAKKAPAKKRPAPVIASALAIPGYDTLSASQVVPRLDALRPAELEAVRRYEDAHRARRTILNRIAQLQA
jgi:hypothetical protein